jgi:branched-chain amino acid transport system ATP-binding protein
MPSAPSDPQAWGAALRGPGRHGAAGGLGVLLDEPLLGLAPVTVEINAAGTAFLPVEQTPKAAPEVAHRPCVPEDGRVALSGPSADLAEDPRLLAALLGR